MGGVEVEMFPVHTEHGIIVFQVIGWSLQPRKNTNHQILIRTIIRAIYRIFEKLFDQCQCPVLLR